MELDAITEDFVVQRAKALQGRWGTRNSRMDDYADLFRLKMWDGEPKPDERRITVPTCFDVVEDARALLLTKPPVISVPPSDVRAVDEDRAERIERYLWGVWDQTHVMQALRDAEWAATALGEGVLRCVYDTMAVEDELPLLVQNVDPRRVYAAASGRPQEDLEVAVMWDRPRREILAEWGEVDLDGAPSDRSGQAWEEWLDESVTYVDYWRLDVTEVDAQPKTAEAEGDEERGATERLVEAVRAVLRRPHREEGDEADGEEAAAKPKKVRRRQVINAVVADDRFVKEPMVAPGYPFLPFVRFAGIRTPLPDEDGALSVLFPITGGARENGAVGVAAAEAEAVAFRHRLVEMFAAPAVLVEDEALVDELDMSPGAVNKIRAGKDVRWLTAPGPHPAADAQIELMQRYVQSATLPDAMRGQMVGDASGLALTAAANVVMMRTAARQEERERACERLNQLILALTEEWAPPDGWEVWGVQNGAAFEAPLRPEEIGGYRRNVVKLSTSLPKDEDGSLMAMASLVGQDLLSRDTFIDFMQQQRRLSSQSPEDERRKILRDKLLFEGDTAQKLAQIVLAEYDPALASALQQKPPEGQQPGGPMAGGPMQKPMGPQGPPPGPGAMMPQGPMPGQGPMRGMPPGVVAPTPNMVGAGGPGGPTPQSVEAMMAMQGQGPPGPPPGAPVPPFGRGGGL